MSAPLKRQLLLLGAALEALATSGAGAPAEYEGRCRGHRKQERSRPPKKATRAAWFARGAEERGERNRRDTVDQVHVAPFAEWG